MAQGMRAKHCAFLLLAAALALLQGCDAPIPPDKTAYIGEWRGADMRLAISSDGYVDYARQKGSGKTSIQAPIARFEGDDLVVGIGWFTTTFKVSQPPYFFDGAWRMVVDGVALTRDANG